ILTVFGIAMNFSILNIGWKTKAVPVHGAMELVESKRNLLIPRPIESDNVAIDLRESVRKRNHVCVQLPLDQQIVIETKDVHARGCVKIFIITFSIIV